MLEFLATYLRDLIHLVAITPDGPIEGRYFGADAAAADQWARTQNGYGRNIYFTLNYVTPGLNKKPTKADIIAARCVHVDIDPPKGAVSWDKQAALNSLMTYGRPSVVIDSGNGLQALWWLTDQAPPEYIEAINRTVERAFQGDHCHNIDRLLRLPGSINYPDQKKRAAGRVPTQSSILVPFNGTGFTVAQLAAAFPPVEKSVAPATPLQGGPVAEYTGPQDDAELIRRMMNAKGSLASAFNAKASFAELWEGRADTLFQHFKSSTGDVYDRSAADAALMAHLAFWTGKDAARMDRLFRQSRLMRPKYAEREDYRRNTIGNAVTNCRKVYDLVRNDPIIPPAAGQTSVAALDADALASTGPFLTIPEMQKYFTGCVYVRDAHRMLIPSGELITPPQFKAYYGGKQFAMTPDNSGASTNAFEAFTENRAWPFPKVATTCFQPLLQPGLIVENKVNVYYPVTIKTAKGDASPYLDLIAKLLPIETDRAIYLAYCAAVVQHIGVKFQWAPVLQGCQGNGKSLLAQFLAYTIGQKYTHTPAAEQLAGQFNAYLENKLLIIVEEVHLQAKRELLDTLKPLITNSRVEVEAKGIDKRMIDNVSNWHFTTNHRDAIVKTGEDRRYAVFFTAQQHREDLARDGMTGDYFPDLWTWARNGGFEIVADFLKNYKIPHALNPANGWVAPDTSSMFDAMKATMGTAEQYVIDAVEGEEIGFRKGWISSHKITLLLKDHHIRMGPNKTTAMMESLGYRVVCRATTPIIDEELKRPNLYIRRDLFKAGLTADDYCAAQGYASSITRPVLAMRR